MNTDTTPTTPKTNSPYPQPQLKPTGKWNRKVLAWLGVLLALVGFAAAGIFTWTQTRSDTPDTGVTVRMQTSANVVSSVRTPDSECVEGEKVMVPGDDTAPRAYGDSALAGKWEDGRLTVSISGGAQKRVSAFFVGDDTAVLDGMDQVQGEFVLNADAFDAPITEGAVYMCIGPVS